MLFGSQNPVIDLPRYLARVVLVALIPISGVVWADEGPLLPNPQKNALNKDGTEEFPDPSTVMKPIGPPPDPVVVLGRASTFEDLLNDPDALPVGQTLPRGMFLPDDQPAVSPDPVVLESEQPRQPGGATQPSRRFDGEPPLLIDQSKQGDMVDVPPLEIPDDAGQPDAGSDGSQIDLMNLEQESPAADPRSLPRFRPVRPGRGVTRYNVGIALSESLLNKIAADVRDQANRVCDRILGANVTGVSNTRSMTRVDCRANAETAQIDMVLQSLTSSSTIGFRPDATVATQGRHRADLTKSVYFDGFQLTTRKPRGVVRATNQNNSVITPLSNLPLVGPLATTIARQQAERTRPVAESIAAERLRAQVVPEFNNAVDAQLVDLNTTLKSRVQPMLSRGGLIPEQLKTSTVDTELRIRARFGEDRAIETSTRRATGRLASLLLHESAINSVIDSLGVAGREVSDRQLQQLLAKLEEIAGTAEKDEAAGSEINSTEPELYSLAFAGEQPISVRFDDDVARLILRVRIKAVGGEALPLQEIRVPIELLSGQTRMRLSFGAPEVIPADGTAAGDLQRLIAEEAGKLLVPFDFERSRLVPIGSRSFRATLGQTSSDNGWLLIAID